MLRSAWYLPVAPEFIGIRTNLQQYSRVDEGIVQCCTGRWWWTPLARECGIQVKVSSHRWSSVHQHLAPLIQFPPNAASVCRASGVNNTALFGRHHFQSGQFPTTGRKSMILSTRFPETRWKLCGWKLIHWTSLISRRQRYDLVCSN